MASRPEIMGEKKHDSFSRLPRAIGVMTLFALYYFAGALGLEIGAVNGFATLIWPSTGIALAALLIFGLGLWPGVALGAFFLNWSMGAPVLAAIGMAAGNTAEALIGAGLLRWMGFHGSMSRLKDAVALILFAALLSTAVSATVGVTSLYLAGGTTPGSFRATWIAWWFGDMMGDLVLAPAILVWFTRKEKSASSRTDPWRAIEWVALMTLVVIGSMILLTNWIVARDTIFQRPFFIFPLLMLVAGRLEQRGVATAMLVVSIVALTASLTGDGRFGDGGVNDVLLRAQVFLAVVAVSEMVLAATIMERREERNALRASNGHREAIMNASLTSIVTMDEEGRIIEFNPAAERTFGHKREDVIGRDMASLIIPPRYRSAHREGLARYLGTGRGRYLGKRLELSAIRASGEEFPVELYIIPLKTEGPPTFTGFLQDIGEKRNAAEQKRRSDEAERFLAQATDVLYASIDFKTTLKHVTQAPLPRFADSCILHLLDEEDPERKRISEIAWTNSIPENEALIREYVTRYMSDLGSSRILPATFASEEPKLVTDASDAYYRELAKDDTQLLLLMKLRPKSILAVPLFLRGKNLGVITLISHDRNFDETDLGVAVDLAGRAAGAIENARLYREAQDAIYARDEFLSIASHELKTPLTALSLQLQMFGRSLRASLAKLGPEAETAQDVPIPMRTANNVARMETQSKRLADLLDELLDLTRIRLGRLQLNRERLDLSALVADAVDRFRLELAQKGMSISVDIAPATFGSWDRIRMEQVVGNLISNAIKYGERRPISVTVTSDGAAKKVRLVVQDGGMGISPDMQGRIFQRFERAGAGAKKIAGLGLGLYITRQIVEAHGGTVQVRSALGEGSIFVVELPMEEAQASDTQRRSIA